MIDVQINNEFGQIIELIKSQYINTSVYKPLSGGSYIDLLAELRSPRKGLINIKNTKIQKIKNVFYGIMLDITIFQKNIQKEFKKMTKKWLKNLIMVELNFL